MNFCISVQEFLSYVCYNYTPDEEIYKYIYRKTGFNELGYAIFNSQLDSWKKELMEEETNDWFFVKPLDEEFKDYRKKHELFDMRLSNVERILNNGIDSKIDYTPKRHYLSKNDENRVLTYLAYAEPLINGRAVMDGNDYAGEILDPDAMKKGAKIIKDLYDEYKDFQFDVEALRHLRPYDYRLSTFERLFDLYNNRVQFVLELTTKYGDAEEADAIKKKRYEDFADIFTTKDWEKYLRVLTECSPRLLEYDETENKYRFTGNKKTQKGCIAQYFKQLKDKGIIDSNINIHELARVLNNNLLGYKICGSSINNQSETYKKIYEKQLFSISMS